MLIKEIESRRDVLKFVKFTHKLYKHCPQYVPSLILDEMDTLLKSPCLEYCKRKMWLAYNEKGQIVGRVAGIINPRANELYGYKRVRFGWFDFVEDFEVAKALLRTVEAWGASEGMNQIHGPLGYNTWNKQGMLVEGFENVPQFNCLYNYAYYADFMDRLGFTKEVDWVQYITAAYQPLPEKIDRLNGMIMRKYKLSILDWKRASDFAPYLDDFFKTYNESFATVHNFIPLTPAEIKASIGMYMRFLRPELNIFVMSPDNKVAAFEITIPSLSRAFQKAKGRLFPFGWFYIWQALRTSKNIDLMLNGASPEWQGKGISSIYHAKLNQVCIERGYKMAISNPQIETNGAVHVWKSYDTEPYTRRRCYIRDL